MCNDKDKQKAALMENFREQVYYIVNGINNCRFGDHRPKRERLQELKEQFKQTMQKLENGE